MSRAALERRPRWQWIVAVGLLVGLLIWVDRVAGWRSVLSAWKVFEPVDAAVVFGLVGLGYVARALRLMHHFGPPLSNRFGATLRVMVLHNAANNLMPMRSGEASFPILLKREFDIRTSAAIASLLWLRGLDLLALLGLAAASWGYPRWGAGGAIAVLIVLSSVPWLGWRLLSRWTPGNLVGRQSKIAAQLQSALPDHARALLSTQAWTLVHWGSKLAAYAWVLHRIGGVDLRPAVIGAVAGELTSVLPIHGVAGAGTYEAGVVAALRPLGVSLDSALSAAVNLHLLLLIVSILAAALALVMPRRRS